MANNNTSSANDNVAERAAANFSLCFKKVAAINKQIKNINERLSADEVNKLDEADLSVRLDYVESLNQNFEEKVLNMEENSDGDVDDTIRSDFMASYFEVKAKLKRKLGINTNQRSIPRSSTLRQFSVDEPIIVRKTRLPELRIPQFSGSYTEWSDFFAMFSTVVANDVELSNLEKFQHLKASLCGAALDTISSLEPTDSNYEKAIDLLKHRFDNKLLLFQTHIKEIFALKNVERNSASSLRQLSDKLNAHVRALETICTKQEMADGFLVYLITSKLDSHGQAKWEEQLHNDKLPSWTSLSSFLDKRCRMLENLESSIKPKPHNQQDNTNVVRESESTQAAQSSLVSSNTVSDISEATLGASVLLATAVILVKNKFGLFVPCRAILDSASQLNFITSRFVNQAQLKVKHSNISISGIGEGNVVADKIADVEIKSCHSNYSASFVAVVIPSITDYQPNPEFDVGQFNIPDNVKLADAEFYKRSRIDILIGASLFFELMSVGQIRCGNMSAVLQKTHLGWVVSGGGVFQTKAHSLATTRKSTSYSESESLIDVVKGFWEIENNYDASEVIIPEDKLCEQHFVQNTIRLPTGEYSVSLPKKLDTSMLGNSYDQALNRFKNLERKLNRMPEVKTKYNEFMKEYSDLQHMSLVKCIPKHTKAFFLPHHCVHKEDSTTTKLRVVFDGSAKSTSGVSLNDTLYAGPTIQPKLFNTLLRFQFFRVALSGDISKMYRCVRINSPDDYLQCILWRNAADEDIKIYKLDTVTYGTKPAAFLAIRAMQQLSIDELISGGSSIEEVVNIREQVTALLKRGNFDIRKWCSNEDSVLSGVPSGDRETFLQFHDGTDIIKTLGLVWNPKSDKFIFSFSHFNEPQTISKRGVLSSIARFYDPLGLIGPVITKAKIFMQNMWKIKLNWDESLPQDLHTSWLLYVSTFSNINKFEFPRYVSMPIADVQIHGFCDASLAAYGACVYVRSEMGGEIKVTLICSKSRVAPLKVLTVPKLELSAALLLAELWSSSYLTLLQERSKWKAQQKNIAVGDMVLIKDENLPPLKWQLGRVTDIIAGSDKVVRVAMVKTSNGISQRSVAKLAILPIENDDVERHNLPTGGGCQATPLIKQQQS
ncbi:uncharacterized protein [Musca autumnalis]|uniref:uncharacterized protein n=1 Tax=Musca autumnalis TaxID=221902 RepID=UPI003CF6C1D0